MQTSLCVRGGGGGPHPRESPGWGGAGQGSRGGAHIPLGVQGLLCSQQRPGQDREELQAHLWVSVRLEAAPEDGDQVGQRLPEGWAWNTRAAVPVPVGGGSRGTTGS